jgi:hypothetical protein
LNLWIASRFPGARNQMSPSPGKTKVSTEPDQDQSLRLAEDPDARELAIGAKEIGSCRRCSSGCLGEP